MIDKDVFVGALKNTISALEINNFKSVGKVEILNEISKLLEDGKFDVPKKDEEQKAAEESIDKQIKEIKDDSGNNVLEGDGCGIIKECA